MRDSELGLHPVAKKSQETSWKLVDKGFLCVILYASWILHGIRAPIFARIPRTEGG